MVAPEVVVPADGVPAASDDQNGFGGFRSNLNLGEVGPSDLALVEAPLLGLIT